MDNEQRTSHFQCKKHFVSINKNSNRFCTDILFSASYTGYKISIYLLAFEHANIYEIVGFTNGFGESILSIVRFYSFMCNLKKILALVLAFACAFTMFAGAAFTDQADIKVDAEVVDTLVSLGVIEGFEDGSFQPNATVTRAQMAKMIYVLRTGKSDASAYNDDKTSFTDIGSHWARGYIKYCQSLGIIAGKSSTIFAPNATVTAQEAAKMLLVTLGYDAEKAGLVGAGWAAKTNALADENGLLEDVNTSFTGPCPRQYAAQLIYNAIDTATVVWRDDAYTNVNVLGADNQTIGEKYMGLKYATGVLMASGKVGLDGTGASEALVVKADEKQTVLGTEYSKNSLIKFVDIKNDYSDLLGMNVKVMYKDKDKVYGVYATDDNDVNIAALASDLDTVSGEAKFKVDDVKYKVNDNGMIIYTIGVDADGDVVINPTKVENTAADIKSKISAIKDNDMEITVVSNDNDEKVDAIFVNNKTFAKLTTVNSTSVSYKPVLLDMKGNTTGSAVKLDLEDDEPEVYDGYKKDDYVFVGADLFNDSVVIEKAQTISGKSESFKSDSIKIDGNWHDYVLGMKDANNKYSYTAKSGKTYTAYVYGSYVYYLTGESGSGSDVDTLLVKSVGDYQKMDSGYETKVYFEDGTEKVINVKTVVVPTAGFDQEDYDKDNKASDNKATVYTKAANKTDYSVALVGNVGEGQDVLTADTLYAYEQDGSDYTLFALNENYASNDVKKVAGTVSYSDKTETFSGTEAEDAAPIFLKYSDDSYKVITGAALKNYKSMTGSGNSVLLADDDNVVAAYIDLGSTGLSSSDTLYGVVKKAYKGTESDGTDTVVYLDLITSEGLKTLETEETSYGDLAKGAIISFTGTYEKANDDITVVSNTQKSETVASGSTAANAESQGYIAISNDWSDSSKLIRSYQGLSFNGGTAYNIAAGKVVSDSVVINIDEDDYVADDATPSKAEELKADNGYYANAFVIVNKDNEIDLLVYETNNRIKDGNNNEVTLTNHADVAAISAGTGLPTDSDNVETVKAGYTVSGLGTGLVGKVATKLTDDKDSNKAISAGDTVTATLTVTADTGYQLSAKAPALAGWTVASESASQWVYTMNITVAA